MLSGGTDDRHYFVARTLKKHAIGRSTETSSAPTVGQDYSLEKLICRRLLRNVLKQSLVAGCGHGECDFHSGPGLKRIRCALSGGLPRPGGAELSNRYASLLLASQ